MPNDQAKPAAREPGLEVLRVALTLCVVALHAGIAYLSTTFPGLAWATHDKPTAIADATCWLTNAFVMPAFFLLSGFGAAKLIERIGPRDFTRHRLRRIGGPLLFGMVVILPLDLYAWLCGWAADGTIAWKKVRSLNFDAGVDDGLWGLSHLWFLEYLLIYSLGYAALVRWGRPRAEAREGVSVSPLTLTVVSLIPATVLAVDPQVLLGFRHTFLPQLANGLFFLPAFVVGVWIAETASIRFSRLFLASGLCCWLMTWDMREEYLQAAISPDNIIPMSTQVIAAGGYALSGWFIALGLVGVALESTRPVSAAVRYFAAASFWIYLIHHPLVGILQVLVKPLEVLSELKFVLVFALAMGVSVALFELLVRPTRIAPLLGVPACYRRARRQVSATTSDAGRDYATPRRAA